MKKILLAFIICFGSVGQAFAITENFNDLSQWVVTLPQYANGSLAQVIPDPTGGSGNVLSITGSSSGYGTITTKAVIPGTSPYDVISFDYWGSPSITTGGGAVGLSYSSVTSDGFYQWIAGPAGYNLPYSRTVLQNTGTWNHYVMPSNDGYYLVLGQINSESGDQVLFRNLTFGGDTVTAPVPEPATYGLMLMGLGVIGFVSSRKKNNLSSLFAGQPMLG